MLSYVLYYTKPNDDTRQMYVSDYFFDYDDEFVYHLLLEIEDTDGNTNDYVLYKTSRIEVEDSTILFVGCLGRWFVF